MTVSTSIVFFLVVALGVVVSLALFDFYRADARPGRVRRLFTFTPGDLGGYSRAALVLASVLGLFLELLLIRWISSEIRIFAYFKNVVLIACFLGFGLGFHLCRRRVDLLATLAPMTLLATLVALPWQPLRELVELLPQWLGAFAEVHVWGVPQVDTELEAFAGLAAALLVAVPLLLLVALTLVPFGQLIGWMIEEAADGIAAYTTNVLASLAGIALFTTLSFLGSPPPVWLALAGALLAALLWRLPRLRWSVIAATLVWIALASAARLGDGGRVYWSPYQKLAVAPVYDDGELVAWQLLTNNSWYQWVIDLSDDFVARRPELLQGVPTERNAYNLPYRFRPEPGSVLVLGAGMGNDVAAALRAGARRVVAVEIDPRIVALGRELHPERPYASPRVEVVVDDARSYVEGAGERFDLIVFALLDSHTTASHFSNVRIDNYVYTREAMAAARRLLAPGGIFVVKFQVEQPWIAARLEALLTEAFGVSPLELEAEASHTTGGRFFVTGAREPLERARADPDFGPWLEGRLRRTEARASPTTDDWPFFYQQQPGLPAAVLALAIALVGATLLALRRSGVGVDSLRAHGGHFFFLGAGFLLLEAQAVSKLALLFGTTWVVNAVVIAAVLLLVVAANVWVARRLTAKGRSPDDAALPPRPVYAALAVSLLAAWALPLRWLFFDPLWLRALVAGLILCLPVFFASIVFITSFARAGFAGGALGTNLLGALCGGLLESLSLWTGLRALWLVALALYAASYLTRRAVARGRPAARSADLEVAGSPS